MRLLRGTEMRAAEHRAEGGVSPSAAVETP